MFTEILNVVDLLGQPTVVIVTVGPAYCCYCSSPRTVVSVPLRHPAPRATLPQLLLRSGDSVKNGPNSVGAGKKSKESVKKGQDRLEPRTPHKILIVLTTTLRLKKHFETQNGFHRLSVSLVLLTRPSVSQCCWPCPLLFCC